MDEFFCRGVGGLEKRRTFSGMKSKKKGNKVRRKDWRGNDMLE